MKIKELREKRGISQARLAGMCHIKPQNMFKYESGVHEPSIKILKVIAEVLEVSVDALIDE